MRSHNFHDVLRNGTEVKAENSATNATNIVYTVPAGVTLYIDSMIFTAENDSGVHRQVYIAERDDGDVFVEFMCRLNILDGATVTVSTQYPTLYTVTTGYDIYVYSPAAGMRVSGCIHGWYL